MLRKEMEETSERRRIAVLSSHINPRPPPPSPHTTPCLQASHANGHHQQQQDCAFCSIIHHHAPAFKLYEDDECMCILDTYPLCHGHSLIIPKSHFPSLAATPPSIIGAMFSKVPLISKAVMKATGCEYIVKKVNGEEIADSFNLLVNNGVAAGQVIFHTHIHIVPRKAHDCLWTSETLRRPPLKLDGEASKLANCIRENLLLPRDMEDGKGEASGAITN